MASTIAMKEHLIKAADCAAFSAEDLRRALADAGFVEELILLPLINDAERLAKQLDDLIGALAMKKAQENFHLLL